MTDKHEHIAAIDRAISSLKVAKALLKETNPMTSEVFPLYHKTPAYNPLPFIVQKLHSRHMRAIDDMIADLDSAADIVGGRQEAAE